MKFDNSYARLSDKLFSPVAPARVPAAHMVLFNRALAAQLGWPETYTEEQAAEFLSGNRPLPGAEYIAQAYAGHQFGHFNRLGDGRAILLGEVITPAGLRLDVQFKGSGLTPYSRRGDGKATLRAMLREYLISEAMHGLGIPTSRSLTVVATGEDVVREEIHEGAVLTRVAASHIRVGTFEYIAHFLDIDHLKNFSEYVIDRHYPEIKNTEHQAFELLKAVMLRQTELIVHWMRVGFIHGVMNTDNTSIAGETFDYGPCAFMEAYHPGTVFSSIDRNGRYAYGNQPAIIKWNLSVLAQALLPLIAQTKQDALNETIALLNSFDALYARQWYAMMCAKLGLPGTPGDERPYAPFIDKLLAWMQAKEAHYTDTFKQLQNARRPQGNVYESEEFNLLWNEYIQLTESSGTGDAERREIMQKTNPAVIPANHWVERALDEACLENDYTLYKRLLTVVQNPYQPPVYPEFEEAAPASFSQSYRTFCGT